MQNLLQIQKLLTDLNTNDFQQLEKHIKTQISYNRKSFETAIEAGNVDSINEYFNKVCFDQDYLKFFNNKIVPHIKSLHYLSKQPIEASKFSLIDSESVETFHLLFQDILDLNPDYNIFKKEQRNDKLTFSLSDILFSYLFNRLKVSFTYDHETPYPKYIFLKPFLQKKPEIFKRTMDTFVNYTLSKIDFQENSLLITELIKFGYKEKLFEQAKNEKNYHYLQTIFSDKSGYNDAFMLKGLSIFNYSMVKQSFQHGIPFFKNDDSLSAEEKANYKNIFSKVFGSKDSLTIQQYIIDNIPDISVGNHIIVKTILYKLEDNSELDTERNNTRMELIQSIMGRYNQLAQEKILAFQSLLEKRTDSLGKEILTKFLNYNTLNNKLSSSFHTKEKKIKI